MEAANRIAQVGGTLTRAERRVAEVVLDQPQLVAFGTVAELAAAADAGAATVVRLAGKLGFDGFSALQTSIQHDLAHQLRPAAVRIREQPTGTPSEVHLRLELDNVRATIEGVDPAALTAVVRLLGDTASHLHVLSGDASRGIALQLADDLAALRPGVTVIEGNEVRVRRQLSALGARDVVVLVDLRRYDRWLVESLGQLRGSGATVVALSDSVLSPLAEVATHTFVVAAAAAGPFDSHVGTLALVNLLVASTADRLRSTATDRLGRAEAAWGEHGSLVDR